MHPHPLHREVVTPCACCRVDTTFTFTSASDQVICKSCRRHQGDTTTKAMQRDRDHVSLWVSEVALLREELDTVRADARAVGHEHQRRVAKLQLENDGLRKAVEQGFAEAAPADVQRILTDRAVHEAHDQRDASYRSRDNAYRALWVVDDMHHRDEGGDTCSCGLSEHDCPALQALTAVASALYDWENKQIARARARRDHGLPAQHPEYRVAHQW